MLFALNHDINSVLEHDSGIKVPVNLMCLSVPSQSSPWRRMGGKKTPNNLMPWYLLKGNWISDPCLKVHAQCASVLRRAFICSCFGAYTNEGQKNGHHIKASIDSGSTADT